MTVMLNVERLNNLHSSVKFREFIKQHEKEIFHAIPYRTATTLYYLVEDNSPIKWVFFKEDFIVLEE